MHAIIIGASGLVGSHLLGQLLPNPYFNSLTALVRKPLPVKNNKLKQVLVDFDHLPDYAEAFSGDVLFSALGTTIGKAGSQDNFFRVDATYQIEAARLAKSKGVQQHALVSALGADAKSSIFYNRVKGETEAAITAMGFATEIIVRPSILLGARNEKRNGEAVAQWVAKNLSFIFSGPLAKYKGVPAEIVAGAMIAAVQNQYKGLHIVENDQLWATAKM
ncbi:MAG: oxidoreductase [Chitinophagales bacterium]